MGDVPMATWAAPPRPGRAPFQVSGTALQLEQPRRSLSSNHNRHRRGTLRVLFKNEAIRPDSPLRHCDSADFLNAGPIRKFMGDTEFGPWTAAFTVDRALLLSFNLSGEGRQICSRFNCKFL